MRAGIAPGSLDNGAVVAQQPTGVAEAAAESVEALRRREGFRGRSGAGRKRNAGKGAGGDCLLNQSAAEFEAVLAANPGQVGAIGGLSLNVQRLGLSSRADGLHASVGARHSGEGRELAINQ